EDHGHHGHRALLADAEQAEGEYRADDEAARHASDMRQDDDEAQDRQQHEICKRLELYPEGETGPEQVTRCDDLDQDAGSNDRGAPPRFGGPDDPFSERDGERTGTGDETARQAVDRAEDPAH